MQTWYAWVSYNQFPMDTKGWLDIIHNFLASKKQKLQYYQSVYKVYKYNIRQYWGLEEEMEIHYRKNYLDEIHMMLLLHIRGRKLKYTIEEILGFTPGDSIQILTKLG